MKYILASLLALGLSAGANAQDSGTQSPFSFGAGARELALGGSGLATVDAATAPFWNASRLACAEYIAASAFHTRLFDSDVTYQYFGLVIPTIDLGGLGLGVFRLGIEGIEERDASNLLLGEFEDNRLGFYLAYGRKVSGYDVGAALSMESHTVGDYKTTSSPGLSVSLGRNLGSVSAFLPEVSLAVCAGNLVAPASELEDATVRQPLSLDMGLSAMLLPDGGENHSVCLSASVKKVESVEADLSLGLEYDFRKFVFARGGLNAGKLAFGAGLEYQLIQFDYALVDRDLGSLHMFSITTKFGHSMSERRELRAQKREAEFRQLMEKQIVEQNKDKISDLVSEGERALADGRLPEAAQHFDRALFMARSTGSDTIAVSARAQEVRMQLDNTLRETAYHRFLDSAQSLYASNRLIEARYFAAQAVETAPDAPEAIQLLDTIDREVELAATMGDLIRTQLWLVDSLTSYGDIDKALRVLASLKRLAPGDKSILLAVNKVLFEDQSRRATAALDAMNFRSARLHVDSACALFPGHKWCAGMREKIDREMSRQKIQVQSEGSSPSRQLSSTVLGEVARHYRAGQDLFARGDLNSAVSEWERVLAIAPDYMSVRDYLVKAYKFIGVEHYGQNNLSEAIVMWKKAVSLDPDNNEITGYIERAENEIRRLKELSYETSP